MTRVAQQRRVDPGTAATSLGKAEDLIVASAPYRIMCDGIDVDVDGHVLHLSNPKLDEKQIAQAVESFRAMLAEQAKQPPPEPPPDYALKYAEAAASLKKLAEMRTSLAAIDTGKATKAQIVTALSAALSLTADVKADPVVRG